MSTPEGDQKTNVLNDVATTMELQKELLTQLVSKLEGVERQQKESQDHDREVQMVQDARLRAHQEDAQKNQKKTWEALKERLDLFERVLKEDKGDAAGGPSMMATKVNSIEAGRVAGGQKSGEGALGEETKGSGDGELSVLIRKLQRDTKTPQERYLESLKDFAEVDQKL